ncbi:MAG: ferritin family protein [Phycisphaerae bacterium]|nr:ferritin family protein [Phycisphaerae bacterium]
MTATVTFTAAELLEMAQQLERNGAEFYSVAAMLPAAAGRRRSLMELAAWEEQHEKTFAEMQAGLAASEMPLTGEAALYVQALVDGHVFESNAHELLSRCQTVPDVLRTAIALEKESIVFYIGLRDMIPPSHRAQLDDILRQEMRHVAILTNELAALKAA